MRQILRSVRTNAPATTTSVSTELAMKHSSWDEMMQFGESAPVVGRLLAGEVDARDRA